jgi:hypothetical protein
MHWVVQENLINPRTRDHLVQLLRERATPYTLVKLVPIFNLLDGDVASPPGPLFVYGSTGLGTVAKERGWAPGYFDENLDYELMLEQYGDLALNAGAVCATLADMPHRFDEFFVRPTLDNKSFAGTVMTWSQFEEFRRGVARVTEDRDVTLRLTDRIIAAPLTQIAAEYRFFVIAGQVVTGCRYKVGDRVVSAAHAPPEVLDFVQGCVGRWAPNAAFAIDVAVAPNSLKVIELNSANSAGFYACDVGAIIDAVNTRLR